MATKLNINKGICCAVGAYVIWGLFPFYWKWLKHVSALELICHRILWAFLILLLIVLLQRQWKSFQSAITRRILCIYLLAAIFVGINWLTYVWAVNKGFIVETSLGYFINPLLSVFLGVIFLRERLRPLQWIPLCVAVTGVLYLTISYGALPWIALTLAFSFGFYGLIKKTAPLGSFYGLTLETGLLLLPAVLFLLVKEAHGEGAFLHTGLVSDLLLIGAGVVTSIPLLLFSAATKRIPLSQVGILQYITPTMQLLIGVLVYKETFSHTHLIGYGLVWIALILFAAESLHANYRALPTTESELN